MRKLLIPAVALLALAGAAAYWAYTQVDDSAEAETHVVRWGNVTVSVSDEAGVSVLKMFAPDGGLILGLRKAQSDVVIDGETGEVLQSAVQNADRSTIDQVLATLQVSALDEETAPWPYGGTQPDVPRERFMNITFIPPAPGSGLEIYFAVGDVATGDGGAYGVQVTNGQSSIGIDAQTGVVFEESTNIAPEDQEAFDRFLATVELTGP